jgi:prevent-host-death family protein
MTRLPAGKVRENFADALNRVAYGRERILLHRRGKDVAVLMPVDDLRLFESLIERLEDRMDLEAAQEAWREQGDEPPKSWKEIKKRLLRR